MKITEAKPEPQFYPITITIETLEEWHALRTAFALDNTSGSYAPMWHEMRGQIDRFVRFPGGK